MDLVRIKAAGTSPIKCLRERITGPQIALWFIPLLFTIVNTISGECVKGSVYTPGYRTFGVRVVLQSLLGSNSPSHAGNVNGKMDFLTSQTSQFGNETVITHIL